MADAGHRGGRRGWNWAWGWNWARASPTAFSLLRHSLHVMKITVANPPPGATPRLPEPRTKPVYEQASINQAPAARLNSSSATPAMIVAPRRAPGFSGSSRQPSGGGGAHSFMTFGLCTRNEKCAAAPLTNRALPYGRPRVTRGLPKSLGASLRTKAADQNLGRSRHQPWP